MNLYPSNFEKLNIQNIDSSLLLDMLRKMLIIRIAEEKISENVESGKINVHVFGNWSRSNWNSSINGYEVLIKLLVHISHLHLALNEDTYSLFAEVLGNMMAVHMVWVDQCMLLIKNGSKVELFQ